MIPRKGVVLARQRETLRLVDALHDCDGVRADFFEYRRVPCLEFLGGKVCLVVLRRCGEGQRQDQCGSERRSDRLHKSSSSGPRQTNGDADRTSARVNSPSARWGLAARPLYWNLAAKACTPAC